MSLAPSSFLLACCTMKRLFGIIGYPLSHSFSPAYFLEKFEQERIFAQYKAFEITSIHSLPDILKKNPTLEGLNVTIPYKQDVINYLDSLSKEAADINAVNCITIKDGLLNGQNTDIIGFEKSLLPLLKKHHHQALILGTGGAAAAVAYVLKKWNIPYQIVSRNQASNTITYEQLDATIINTHQLIINTTPLGTYPNINDCPPIPYALLTAEHLLYDLIYNPVETKFLAQGKAAGCSIKNGFEMLKVQAEESWKIWNQ